MTTPRPADLVSAAWYRCATVALLFEAILGVVLNGLILIKMFCVKKIGRKSFIAMYNRRTARVQLFLDKTEDAAGGEAAAPPADTKTWTPSKILLLNLVGTNLLRSIAMSLSILSAFHRGWLYDNDVCEIYAFISALMVYVVTITTAAMSVERYKGVKKMPASNGYSVIYLIITVWSISLGLAGLPYFTDIGEYTVASVNISCSLNWKDHRAYARLYFLVLAVAAFVIPVAVITMAYIGIIIEIEKKPQRRNCTNPADAKLRHMVILNLIAFYVSSFSYFVLPLVTHFAQEVTSSLLSLTDLIRSSLAKVPPQLWIVSFVLALTSVLSTATLNIVMDKQGKLWQA